MTALRVTFAALVACASLTASAWWETTVTTNKWEYDGVEYLQGDGSSAIDTGISADVNMGFDIKVSGLYNSSSNSIMGAIYTTSSPTYRNSLQYQNSGTLTFYKSDKIPYYSVYATTTIIASFDPQTLVFVVNGEKYTLSSLSSFAMPTTCLLYGRNYVNGEIGNLSKYKFHYAKIWNGNESVSLVPVVHEGEGKMLDLVHGTLYANAGTGAFSYGAVTGTVNCVIVSTNRVYHANLPASAYDALSPWNAPERTRIGGDDRTLRPSAQIKQD